MSLRSWPAGKSRSSRPRGSWPTDQSYWSSEEVVAPPEVSWAVFLVHALVLDRKGNDLYRYVDFPQAKFGDLYYLQRLSLCLRAYARSCK